jgi:hypothetical protein
LNDKNRKITRVTLWVRNKAVIGILAKRSVKLVLFFVFCIPLY